MTSASQRTDAAQQSRITADSFRSLTARLKVAAKPVVPDIIPSLSPPSQAAPTIPVAVQTQVMEPAPAQTPAQTAMPVQQQVPETVQIPPQLQSDSLHYDDLLEKTEPIPSPQPVVAAPEQPQETAPDERLHSVAIAPEQTTLPVEPVVIAPRVELPTPQVAAPQPTFETFTNAKPVQPAPQQQDHGLVIASSRISSVLARQDQSESLGFNLPPILPPPEPPAPKPVVEPVKPVAIPTGPSLPQLNSGRRKIAPSDPELEHVMRMVAALPSLDERAAYLEEAARFEIEQSLPVVPQEPTDDLEALAMQHVAAFKHQAAANLESTEPVESVDTLPEPELIIADEVSSEEYIEVESEPASFAEHVEPVAAIAAKSDKLPEPTAELQHEHEASIEPPPSRPKSSILKKKPLAKSEQSPELSSSIINLSDAQAEDLARSLLDMMSASVSTGLPQERALAADTLLRILPRLQLRPLVHLSERVAMMDAPPILLIGKLLADDRIEVSGPLLENAISIADQDLFDIIEEGDIRKLRLLARRRRLSRVITDRLVSCGHNSVLLTLVRNAHAEVSHEGFLALAKSVESEPELLAPLCTRADLPPPQAFELFWLAPTQLRRYLLSRFLTDSETLTKILKITLAMQGEKPSAENFPGNAVLHEAFAEIRAGQGKNASEKLASFAQINSQTVQRIFSDSAGEPLIALLKALGLPRQELDDLLLSLQQSSNGMIDPARDRTELCNIFDTLSFNKARILLTYWDWSTLKAGPYAAVH